MSLEHLAIVGNGQLAALVDAQGSVAWCCWPRPDGDPVFCGLLNRAQADGARGSFAIELLDIRNSAGLLSEHADPVSGRLWGNFPQTHNMAGIITTAARLSRRWEDEV